MRMKSYIRQAAALKRDWISAVLTIAVPWSIEDTCCGRRKVMLRCLMSENISWGILDVIR